MTNTVDQGPAVRFPPPLLFGAGLLLGALLSRLQPVALPWVRTAWIAPVALVLCVLGVGLAVIGVLTFRRADTAVYPNQPARTLVTHGVYAYTRNPMYVGMTVAYLGLALATGSVWPLLLLPAVLALLVRFVIQREERHLMAKFPAEYGAYCADVGRWL